MKTLEQIEVKPVYTALDASEAAQQTGLPGEAPYTRGPYPNMYLGRLWTIRQYAGFSTAKDSNGFYRRALSQGQRGLSVAFDLATHRGYDSDHPRVRGDVGKAGVAIDSVEDMKVLFEGIPLAETSVSMTMNGAVLPVLAAYVVCAEEQGVDRKQLAGTIQNDILKEFMVRNTYIYPPAPSLRIVADVIEYASRELPRFNSVSISGYHMHEAGASADLELGLTIADGLEYVKTATQRGMDVDTFAPRLSFFFAIGMDFFMEVAKLRAARLLWSELLAERYQPRDARSLQLRMHCQTSGASLTAEQPHNNIVRTTLEALAAVLGGTQSLHTNAYDEALALPSDHAARVALNTQLVLAHEAGLTRVADPLGGSYYVESLTRELAERARAVVAEMDKLGGMTRAVALGVPQRLIEEVAVRRQARLDRGLDVLVGVNQFRSESEAAVDIRQIDNHDVRATQVRQLSELRAKRDDGAVRAALEALERGAEGQGNLLELSISAMRARATVGEVSEALVRVFGRHEGQRTGVSGVYGSYYTGDPEFGAVRAAVQRFESAHGRRPRILVTKLGQDGHDRGARIVATGLADCGFDVDVGPLFQTPEEAAQTAVDSDVHWIGVSTQAGAHSTLVPELIQALAARGGSGIKVVCGGIIPEHDRPALERVGVTLIFGPGTPLLDIARALLGGFGFDVEATKSSGA